MQGTRVNGVYEPCTRGGPCSVFHFTRTFCLLCRLPVVQTRTERDQITNHFFSLARYHDELEHHE